MAQGDVFAAEAEIQRAAEALGRAGENERALADYAAALARFEALGGHERTHREAVILQGLGLGELEPATPVATLSGGQKTRLGLATLLLREPDLLLLDEPLNHLDLEGREHFERALDAFEGTVVAVAHDRAFLRHFARRVVEIREGKVHVFEGEYADYELLPK
jgi:ATPase subunit of ABC transporter with duplicated ATPase domains